MSVFGAVYMHTRYEAETFGCQSMCLFIIIILK